MPGLSSIVRGYCQSHQSWPVCTASNLILDSKEFYARISGHRMNIVMYYNLDDLGLAAIYVLRELLLAFVKHCMRQTLSNIFFLYYA